MPNATTDQEAELPDMGLDRMVGHSLAGRLVAQRGLFSGPDQLCPVELYASVLAGTAERERQRLVLHPQSTVTTDTYFGRFPASYWQRWTVVEEVDVELVFSGRGVVSLVASDARGKTRVIARQAVRQDGKARFTAKLDKFVDGGFLWLDFATGTGKLAITDVCWTVAPPERLRATAAVICTFNRVDDCLSTLTAMLADPQALEVLDAVYVVDQGNDPVSSRPAFSDTRRAFGDQLRYLQQPNLGGSGGFSRGIFEITEVNHAEHANILLMDDDVLLEPEVLIRLTAFANRCVEPAIVGAQMLRLYEPTVLLAGAEQADFERLGYATVNGALENADMRREPVVQGANPNRGDRRVDAHYTGWWTCLIPSELIAELGYPIPFFSQWDDTEYCYRARAHGRATITLPGAALWHADFDRKDRDNWNEYFAVRNSLIIAALHADIPPRRHATILGERILMGLVGMRYGWAATLIKAIEDYLEGPSILQDGGVEALAQIRKLRAEYPDTIIHPARNVPGLRTGEIYMVPAAPEPSRHRLVLLKRLLTAVLGRPPIRLGSVTTADAAWWHVSLFETAVVTDASQEGVRLRRRDRQVAIDLARRAARALRRLLKDSARLRQEYRTALPQLATKENWQRLYGLGDRVANGRPD